jgi:hypothetical protein
MRHRPQQVGEPLAFLVQPSGEDDHLFGREPRAEVGPPRLPESGRVHAGDYGGQLRGVEGVAPFQLRRHERRRRDERIHAGERPPLQHGHVGAVRAFAGAQQGIPRRGGLEIGRDEVVDAGDRPRAPEGRSGWREGGVHEMNDVMAPEAAEPFRRLDQEGVAQVGIEHGKARGRHGAEIGLYALPAEIGAHAVEKSRLPADGIDLIVRQGYPHRRE